MGGVALVFVMCVAQVLGLLSFGTFGALLPILLVEWGISNTEAGWLSGVFYAGYMVSVPVLVALTDRRDARGVFFLGCVLGAVAGFGFAFLAEGFWTALVLRMLLGIGFAGSYMPGLKALTDRVESGESSRAVAFYTASFGLGGALSIYLAGEVAAWLGWRWAFGLSACGSCAALVLAGAVLRAKKPQHRSPSGARLLDFRPVFANRRALGYIIAYAWHCWELFALVSWAVAFLTFSLTLQPSGAWVWSPTMIGALVALVALPASVLGNEASLRYGRRRTVIRVMIGSALLGGGIGFGAALPYPVVVALCLLYGMSTAADSASITAGAVGAAAPHLQGATLAVHSTIGFAGGFLGPLATGAVLDLAGGGASVQAWGWAFASAAMATVIGAVLLPFFVRE